MERKRQQQRSYTTNKMDDSADYQRLFQFSLQRCIIFTSVWRKFTYTTTAKDYLEKHWGVSVMQCTVYRCLNKHKQLSNTVDISDMSVMIHQKGITKHFENCSISIYPLVLLNTLYLANIITWFFFISTLASQHTYQHV